MRSEQQDYAVGYGRPPRHTQFKAGQSGNPRGRPGGAKNLKTLVNEALNEPVTVAENGRRRKITKREAMIAQLVNKSAAADLRATKMLLDIIRDIEAQSEPVGTESAPSPAELNEGDQALIARYLARSGAQQ